MKKMMMMIMHVLPLRHVVSDGVGIYSNSC